MRKKRREEGRKKEDCGREKDTEREGTIFGCNTNLFAKLTGTWGANNSAPSLKQSFLSTIKQEEDRKGRNRFFYRKRICV